MKNENTPTDGENSQKTEALAGLPDTACSVFFVGGIADGQRRLDPKSKYWKVDRPTQNTLHKDIYRRERVRLPRRTRDLIIYVLDSLTIEQATEKMFCSDFQQNVKEHAPPLAGASVETGVEVHATGNVDHKAASGGCCVSSCSRFFFRGGGPVSHQLSMAEKMNLPKLSR